MDFTFHDLRHTFESLLIMSSVSLRTVADQLGHRDNSDDHELCASVGGASCECGQSTEWCFWFSTSPGRPRARTTHHRTHRDFFNVKVPLTGLEPVLSALRGRRVNHLHHSGKLIALDGCAAPSVVPFLMVNVQATQIVKAPSSLAIVSPKNAGFK